MKAAVLHTFGETPRFEEFAEPVPVEGKVLVEVLAAGLHPIVRSLAHGSHHGSTGTLPLIPGIDGVGRRADGRRVYFAGLRDPYGTMAERAAASARLCVPLPDSLNEFAAAALFNPGMSAWLALKWRGQLAPGETVLVLGATGTAGKLAIQMAKLFGAGKVIALGRNERILSTLPALGADVVISLEQPDEDLVAAIARESEQTGIHVIVDYLWGRPTEAVIAGITRKGLMHVAPRVRLVEVGQVAGDSITLPAPVLRSSGLEIYGCSAGTAPIERVMETIPQLVELAASGKLSVDVETIPLAEVESAWQRPAFDNRRLVFVP